MCVSLFINRRLQTYKVVSKKYTCTVHINIRGMTAYTYEYLSGLLVDILYDLKDSN